VVSLALGHAFLMSLLLPLPGFIPYPHGSR